MGSRALQNGWPLAPGKAGAAEAAPPIVVPITPITISGTPGAATVGTAYTFTPSTANGSGTKAFTLSGSLPAGLSFLSTTGTISGTPSTAGTASGIGITVTDASGSASLSGLSIVVSAAGATLMAVGSTYGMTGDGITSTAAAGGIRNAVLWFERLMGYRVQPVPNPNLSRSGTTITRTLGSNTPWINPIAIDLLSGQKPNIAIFGSCGANDNILSTDPVADPTFINDWKAALTYHVAQNSSAGLIPVVNTWPSIKTGEATYRSQV